MATLAAGQARDRAAIDEQYKWNLADVYPNDAAWRAAKEASARELSTLRRYQGTLGSSAAVLADALETMSRLDKAIARLSVYSGMLADQDTREAVPQGMQQEMQQLAADFKAQTAYVEPELLHAGAAVLERFLASEPRLTIYTLLPARPRAAGVAHALGRRRDDPCRREPAGRVGAEHLQHPRQRGFPLSDGHAD